MPADPSTVARRLSRLEESAGRHPSAAIRPLYRLVDDKGHETNIVFIDGTPVDEDTIDEKTDVVFSIHKGIFRELSSGKKYVVLSGGRGSGRSHSVARYLLGLGIVDPARFLMTREIQSSLKESVHFLLSSIIDSSRLLSQFYTVQESGIYGRTGSEFIFRGVRDFSADALKSYEGLRYAWVEEAQSISRRSLDTLIPTIREEGSRIIATLNPRRETDPVYADFIDGDPRSDTARSHWVIDQNPFASDSLRAEAEALRLRDPERYLHVYQGGLELYSDTRIFNNFTIREIDIEQVISERKSLVKKRHDKPVREARHLQHKQLSRIENDFLIGADFGFSDPSCAVLLYVDPDNERLFILDEVFEANLSPDQIVSLFKRLPRVSDGWPVYADSSRPGLIAHLQQRKVNAVSAKKLELQTRIDGLKRWAIFIDPKCEHAIREFGLYSWKIDRQGTPLPIPEDRNNHIVDAVAYAMGTLLEPKIRGDSYGRLSNLWL